MFVKHVKKNLTEKEGLLKLVSSSIKRLLKGILIR